ncbi:ribosome biogenesis factor YjgA [Aliikangiella sp. G2MR2-5]|uniref:ribosome biogenesis factor YjgA n=1 Tax=Aliikangiella sp. G2MR2-5 TaxID=2788943 RepID=UPI0018A9EB1D|nr:ribosome biogenesis factor YjgA [Aliikangiella sp. G2MR2-5]
MTKDNKVNEIGEEFSADEDFISKTQLKKEAKALQQFALELIELPDKKLKLLPLNDVTKTAVRDFHRQSGNIAKKRHLAFIGKCLRNDDAEQARVFLSEDKFAELRGEPSGDSVNSQWLNKLILEGDPAIQLILDEYDSLDRQTLRQHVRNINNAKVDNKRQGFTEKLRQYLFENGI